MTVPCVMKLENFDLTPRSFGAVELQGLGHSWDLHNFAIFKALAFNPERNELVLEWVVDTSQSKPWGGTGNKAAGCRLRFTGLRSVMASPRNPIYPLDESTCLEMISKVVPGEREYPFKETWAPDEPFHLRLDFQDERQVEIDAESVSLEAIL